MKRRNNSFIRPWLTAFYEPVSGSLLVAGTQGRKYSCFMAGVTCGSAASLVAHCIGEARRYLERRFSSRASQVVSRLADNRLRIFILAPDSDLPREYWNGASALIFSERSAEFDMDGWRVHVKTASAWGWQGESLMDFSRGYAETECALLLMGGGMMASPALTGAYLAESLLPSEVPIPPDDFLQALSQTTQNRVEYFFPFVTRELFEYDQRFAYAAHAARELPGMFACRVTGDQFTPYEPGFYVAGVSCPENWQHVGLLPRFEPGRGTDWPTSGEFWTFATEPEIRLAKAHGWGVRIDHGWRFEKARPLENWKRKICAARQLALEVGTIEGQISARQLKAILHQAIGKFYARGYTRERLVTEKEFLEIDALDFTREGKMLRVTERVENDGRHYMPHVAAYIWALSRTAVLTKALTIPKPLLAGFNADAIFCAVETGWGDTGSPGQFVLKSSQASAIPVTLNSIAQVRAFLQGVKNG